LASKDLQDVNRRDANAEEFVMKVFTHSDFLSVYVREPAAAPGRIESVLEAIRDEVSLEDAFPASEDDILAVHSRSHVQSVTRMGLYNIAALAAGAAIQTALAGIEEPSFGLIRPPGHHASSDHAWGFCYFNNMAIALEHLKATGHIRTAHVLDFDLHYGDGTVNILGGKGYVSIHNPDSSNRKEYLTEVAGHLDSINVDIIAISAGFDNHVEDWGMTLHTEDYQEMGRMVHSACQRLQIGCFALLEGGYNHNVLGKNVRAFLQGIQGR
jgi:acetoin utilization deacetylase AcuC-like enzyme